jgi:hypothetical protein
MNVGADACRNRDNSSVKNWRRWVAKIVEVAQLNCEDLQGDYPYQTDGTVGDFDDEWARGFLS